MAGKNYDDFRSLVADLGAKEKDIVKAVADSVVENINIMEAAVKAGAPRAGDQTPTVSGLFSGGGKVVDYNIANFTFKKFSNNNMNAVFGIGGEASELAAWIEFGTGRDAAGYVPTLSTSFQKQALQFYKNGKGTLIRQPFFIPPWYRTKDKLLKDAQANLDKLKI